MLRADLGMVAAIVGAVFGLATLAVNALWSWYGVRNRKLSITIKGRDGLTLEIDPGNSKDLEAVVAALRAETGNFEVHGGDAGSPEPKGASWTIGNRDGEAGR